jgi:hypothetical protein
VAVILPYVLSEDEADEDVPYWVLTLRRIRAAALPAARRGRA